MIARAARVYFNRYVDASDEYWALWILFVAIVLAAGFALDGCAPSPPPFAVSGARLDIHNTRVSCSGVRIGSHSYLTARHCGNYFEVSGTGEIAIVYRSFPRDLVELRSEDAPRAPTFPPHPYLGDDMVRLDLRRGPSVGYVTERGWDWIRIAARCFPGDSGSPVFASNGLVAIISKRSPTACLAVLTVVQ